MDTTDGTLLGGRVLYRQPARGHRTGIEPVFLAAAIPACPGDRVLEAGLGAGAGLLCLAARVPGLLGTGIELDAETAALARCNLRDNGLLDWPVLEMDVLMLRTPGAFTHAFANPPWHDAAGTPSADGRRLLAKREAGAGLEGWAAALARAVRPGGTVTLAVPGAFAARALRALQDAGCGGLVLAPLWPKHGRDARLAIVRGRRGSRTPNRLAPGLVLHREDGRFTTGADAVLRDGSPLRL
ncbi:MAG TPA: methyltransferase [Acetobacteraceae bacterium]